MSKHSNVTKEIVVLAYFSAITVIVKFALLFLPNIELVTFLLIIYTLLLGLKRSVIIATIFIVVEGTYWGFGVQSYIWIVIVVIVSLLRFLIKDDNFIAWSLVSGFFGLTFGLFAAIPKIFIYDLTYAISYYLLGILFDVIHMVGNYVVMLLLGQIVYQRLHKLLSQHNII